MSDLSANEIDALLDTIREAMEKDPNPDDAYTTKELMKLLKLAGPAQYKRLLDTLTEMAEHGLVECFLVQRRALSRMAKVPGYRFTKAS